ncbi:MAG: putative flippase GtrA [Patiriisocius sp.]|jgi:putative flippase GtrA
MLIRNISKPHNIAALVRYTFSGVMAVATDIGILYLLINAGVEQSLAVMISVAASGVVHYLICRYYVFSSNRRSFIEGFIYFIGIVGMSVALNILIYLLLIQFVPLHFAVLRGISIGMVGLLSFVLNAHYNFGTFHTK